ncbi:MAG: SH3 domain-containing protein [Eubacteriales bacterium]|nr:SH3 domain-containing protein [Clostridiales bacterium]MDY5709418.1 SH3 domain-containing protein [Eubacteriales bacterium]
MNRRKKYLAAMLIVLMMIPAAAYAASYRYATEPVMFRTGPSVKYYAITELQAGDQVEFLGTSGNWSKVKWNRQTGYVFTKYLSSFPSVLPNTVAERFATATGHNINVRSGPGTSYKKLGKIAKGETFPVVDISGKWLNIEWEGVNAFVYSRYFVLTQPQSGISTADAIQKSGYFKTNASVYLGTFMDSSNVLNIRVSKGTSTSKINRELKSLLGDAAGSFRVVSSSLPYYVNEEYIKELLNTVNDRYSKLGARDKERCGFSGAYYDAAKDCFIVEIIDLDNTKKQIFKQLILNWDAVTFKSVASLAVPMG